MLTHVCPDPLQSPPCRIHRAVLTHVCPDPLQSPDWPNMRVLGAHGHRLGLPAETARGLGTPERLWRCLGRAASGDGARLTDPLTVWEAGWVQGGSVSVPRSGRGGSWEEVDKVRELSHLAPSQEPQEEPWTRPSMPLTLRSMEAVPPSWHLAPRGWHPEGTGLVCSEILGRVGARRPQEPHNPSP